MPLLVALLVVVGLLFVLWIAFAKDPGPAPADVAIAYERAWDLLDFDLLYDLSGPQLRDGMRRDEFVAAKRAAYERSGHRAPVGAHVSVDETVAANETAVVVTRVTTGEGSICNDVVLEKTANGWVVVRYAIRDDRGAG